MYVRPYSDSAHRPLRVTALEHLFKAWLSACKQYILDQVEPKMIVSQSRSIPVSCVTFPASLTHFPLFHDLGILDCKLDDWPALAACMAPEEQCSG